MTQEIKEELHQLLQIQNSSNGERIKKLYNQYSGDKFSACLCKQTNISRLYLLSNGWLNTLNNGN